MKNILLLFSVLLVFSQCSKAPKDLAGPKASEAWRSKAPAPSTPRSIKIGDYQTFTLDNGLRVIVVENHKLPRVSYQISLNNDPVFEGDQAGYVSFAGELLTKGTKSRSKAQFDNEVDFIGASISSSSSGIFASGLKKHSEKLLDLMTDALLNPTFPQDEFNKAKSQTKSGLASAKTDPNAISSNVASVLNFGKEHPYGTITTEQTIDAITREKCMEYYNQFFKPNNAFLVIVGDITLDEARKQANKYFASWQRGDIPTFAYPMPKEPSERKVAFAHKDGAVQSVIRVTYPIQLKPGSSDDIAARVVNDILGGGVFSGRLMQNLREKKAYTYGARSSMSSDKLVGSFSAFASVRNEVTDSSVYEFLYELDRMVKQSVTESELSLVKNSISGNFARSLESPQTIANFALNTFRYNLPKDYYNTYLERLDKLTVAEVNAAAKKFVRPENAYVLVVGDREKVAEALLKYDADGKIDYYDAFGFEKKYDEVAIPSNLTGLNVIEDYLDAIGGIENVQKIKTMKAVMGLNIMGRDAEVSQFVEVPNKFAMKMGMGGMVLQEQKVNGDKGVIAQMGQPKKMISKDDEEYKSLISEANPVKQLLYLNKDAYKLEITGVDEVEGDKCYKVSVKKGDDQTIEYYSIKSGLLLRSVSQQGEGEEAMTITTDYKEYKDVSGIQFPHNIITTGAAPFPLDMKASMISINEVLDAAIFSLE